MTTKRLLVTGDLMLQRPPRSPDLREDGELNEVIKRADVALANLEVPITDCVRPADKTIAMRAPTSVAAPLKKLGFDVVSLANNHALDMGHRGLEDTWRALAEGEIAHFGTGGSLQDSLTPWYQRVEDEVWAFIGLCSALPSGFSATENRPGLAPLRIEQSYVVDGVLAEEQPGTAPYVRTRALEEDLERACRAIEEAKEEADFVVVSIHWGVPPAFLAPCQGELAEYQRPVAQAMVDAGAGLIVGHHPHVIHGMEVIAGCPVFYSCGNFLFHPTKDGETSFQQRPGPPYDLEAHRSAAFYEAFCATVEVVNGAVSRVEIHPLLLDEEGEPSVATGEDRKRLLEVVETKSRRLSGFHQLEDSVISLE